MRTIRLTWITAALFLVAGLFGKSFAQSDLESWTELRAFHKVMAQTFHPSEDGNFEPIKTRAGEMVQKAEALKASKIPASFDNKSMRKHINALVKKSKKLEASIKAGASDATIKQSLSELHDVFHKIVGLCQPSGEHHEGHEGHNHGNHEGHTHE